MGKHEFLYSQKTVTKGLDYSNPIGSNGGKMVLEPRHQSGSVMYPKGANPHRYHEAKGKPSTSAKSGSGPTNQPKSSVKVTYPSSNPAKHNDGYRQSGFENMSGTSKYPQKSKTGAQYGSARKSY